MLLKNKDVLQRGVLREHSSTLVLLQRTLDLLAVALSGYLAYAAVFSNAWLSHNYRLALVYGVLSSGFFFDRAHLYRGWRGISLVVEWRLMSFAWAAMVIASAAVLGFAGFMDSQAATWLLTWGLIGWLFLTGYRVVLRITLRWIRSHGLNQRSVVIVGLNERGLAIADQIRRSAWVGLQLRGYFDDRTVARMNQAPTVPYLGNTQALARFVSENRVDQVWLVYPLCAEHRVKRIMHELRHCTVDIRLVLDIFAFDLCNHSIVEVAGVPILNLTASPMRGVNAWVKAVEDRLIAGIVLLLLSPLMLAIAIGVKASSAGPVFFRQERISWNGRSFTMMKFRSMPENIEAESGPVWARAGEQRATRFGAFLRRTSLDELPQLINVLRGDMSIVGPRPERPVFVEQFKDQIPDYMKKHLVKAGITGWAQVNGWRGNTDLKKRIEYDLYYIEHWSFWFDMKILFLTLFRGFVHRNAY